MSRTCSDCAATVAWFQRLSMPIGPSFAYVSIVPSPVSSAVSSSGVPVSVSPEPVVVAVFVYDTGWSSPGTVASPLTRSVSRASETT